MEQSQIINKIEEILDDAQTGIMTTIDDQGKASLRWMTPAVLKYPAPAIYCFSVPKCEKLKHLAANNNVVWMIQRRDLKEIVKDRGFRSVAECMRWLIHDEFDIDIRPDRNKPEIMSSD